MNEPRVGELARFCAFSYDLIRSWDVDPFFPVLKLIYQRRGLVGRSAHWQTCLFLAYHHTPSCLAVFRECSEPAPELGEWANRYPLDSGRRGLRGGLVRKHLADVYDKLFAGKPGAGAEDGPEGWVTEGWGSDPTVNFSLFWQKAQTIWNNGRWSSFKWAELLKRVHGLPLAAPDLCLDLAPSEGVGPGVGLRRLYGLPERVPLQVLNAYSHDLWGRVASDVGATDWELFETCLCKFNSHRKGTYYVGRDIDEMQGWILEAQHAGWLAAADAIALYEARASVIPSNFLGERGGWEGIQKHRLKEGKEKVTERA